MSGYPRVADQDPRAQGDEVTCPRSHSKSTAGPDSDPDPPAWDQVVLSRPLCRPSNTRDSGPVPGPVEAADTEAGPRTRTAVCSAPPWGAWRMLTRAWPTQTGLPLLPVHLAPEAPPPPSGPDLGRTSAPALLTFYFLSSGHERCHFPTQNLAPSNRPCKWPVSSAHLRAKAT